MTSPPVAHDPRSTQSLVDLGERTMPHCYRPQPIIISHGEGCWLTDTEGRSYLDFLSGIAVSSLGHAHPDMVQALQAQVARVLHVSNAYWTAPQIRLQSLLAERSFGDRVYLCNSGAEANEAAIKLARRYQSVVRGTPRFEVITFERSFHGRTMGALSATAQLKYHVGFEPMVPGFVYAPYNDLDAVRELIGAHTAAILVEPIQGEGGIRVAEPAFLVGLREICDEHGIVLIFDEVQTGVGRTGTLFAHERYGVTPDVMALAKGLGGGAPIGAMIATEKLSEGFTRGSHATTYGGNPLASTAAVTVLEVIARDGLCARVERTGERLRARLQERLGGRAGVRDVRGVGQLTGVEVDTEAAAALVVGAARECGLLLNTAGGVVLRLVPPLIVTDEEVDTAVDRLAAAFDDVGG